MRKILTLFLITTSLAFLAPYKAVAQSYAVQQANKAYEATKANESEGRRYFNQAQSEEENGNYSSACEHYKEAISYWGEAIRSSMGMMVSREGGFDNDTVSQNNHSIMANSEIAEKHKREVCGKPNQQRSSPSPNVSTNDNGIYDAQIATNKAEAMTLAAKEQYGAGNYAKACEYTREATKLWTRAGELYYNSDGSQVHVSATYAANVEASKNNEKAICEP